MTLLLTVLLGFCGMVLDVGNWYMTKADLQSAADMAALDGANALPTSQAAALAAANARYQKNGRAGDTVTPQVTSYLAANDSVTVTASRTVQTFFTGLFGINQATITVKARATLQSFASVTSAHNVMPWGVLQGALTPGQAVPLYTTNTGTSNNGALSMPYQSGSSCPTPNGADPYRDTVGGSANACTVTVGQTIDTLSGNNSGPTAQGLNTRITSQPWKTLSQIARANADGTYDIIDPSSPQLILMPVVVSLDGSPTWPSGGGTIRVVGFAWFAILSCGDPTNPSYCANTDGKQVNGVFLRAAASTSNATLGPWNGQANAAYTYSLTQ